MTAEQSRPGQNAGERPAVIPELPPERRWLETVITNDVLSNLDQQAQRVTFLKRIRWGRHPLKDERLPETHPVTIATMLINGVGRHRNAAVRSWAATLMSTVPLEKVEQSEFDTVINTYTEAIVGQKGKPQAEAFLVPLLTLGLSLTAAVRKSDDHLKLPLDFSPRVREAVIEVKVEKEQRVAIHELVDRLLRTRGFHGTEEEKRYTLSLAKKYIMDHPKATISGIVSRYGVPADTVQMLALSLVMNGEAEDFPLKKKGVKNTPSKQDIVRVRDRLLESRRTNQNRKGAALAAFVDLPLFMLTHYLDAMQYIGLLDKHNNPIDSPSSN